jgi:hypothetical protein
MTSTVAVLSILCSRRRLGYGMSNGNGGGRPFPPGLEMVIPLDRYP